MNGRPMQLALELGPIPFSQMSQLKILTTLLQNGCVSRAQYLLFVESMLSSTRSLDTGEAPRPKNDAPSNAKGENDESPY